jgi:hypothetical protein
VEEAVVLETTIQVLVVAVLVDIELVLGFLYPQGLPIRLLLVAVVLLEQLQKALVETVVIVCFQLLHQQAVEAVLAKEQIRGMAVLVVVEKGLQIAVTEAQVTPHQHHHHKEAMAVQGLITLDRAVAVVAAHPQ